MKTILHIPIHKIRPLRFNALTPFIRLGLLTGGIFLAGGSLRALINRVEPIQDYDLFFESEDGLNATKTKLVALGFELIFECPEGKLFTYKRGSLKIQCICEQFYLSASELISSFDFYACAAAFDGNILTFYPGFVKDVKTKRLTLFNLTYPVATLKRIIKYKAKGFNVHFAAIEYVEKLTALIAAGPLTDEQKRVYID